MTFAAVIVVGAMLASPPPGSSSLQPVVFASGDSFGAAFVTVFPRSIRVGGSGALEVQFQTPDPRKPVLRAFSGGFTDLSRRDGVWTAKYEPDAKAAAPGYDVILAESRDGATASVVVELVQRTKVPVPASKAVSELSVNIAGRDFGPFGAGIGDLVRAEVEIPPGVDEMEVTSVVPGLPPLVTRESLALPPLRRVFLEAPGRGKIGRSFEVVAVIIDRKGGISRTRPKVSLDGSGTVSDVSEIGPGVWRVKIVPRGGAIGVVVRGEGSRGRVRVVVPPAPAPEKTPEPTPPPTPELVAEVPAIPLEPTCEELAVVPGEITTSAALKSRIDEAIRAGGLVQRRDALIALACLFPEEHAVRLQLTASHLLLGDYPRTIELAEPLLSEETERHDEHRALALSYAASAELRLGRVEAAIRHAKGAESLLPGLYSATYTLGAAHYLNEDYSSALAALLSAYRAAPGFASEIEHAMLANLLEARGDRGEAAHHGLAAARLDANDVEAWREAARLAESAGQWARAHEVWRIVAASVLPGFTTSVESNAAASRAAIAASNDPEVDGIEAALQAEREGRQVQAIEALEKVLARNRRNAAARWLLAGLLLAGDRHDEAAVQIYALLNQLPKWAPALILAGDIEFARGRTERAEFRFREAASLQPPVPMSSLARWRLSAIRNAP